MTPVHRKAPRLALGALWRALAPLTWREWQHHPWRHGSALLALALGVALAWSVHLINRSALAEFSAAVRSANGDPDLSLRAASGLLDDALFARVASDSAVDAASPVLELDTYARRLPAADAAASAGSGSSLGESATAGPSASAGASAGTAPTRLPVRVWGVDALRVLPLAADLLPRPAPGTSPFAALDPDVVFLNAAARARLDGLADASSIQVLANGRWQRLRVAGSVAAPGAPALVMDLASAQHLFGHDGRLSRIDLKLAPGVTASQWLARVALPPGVSAAAADEDQQRVSNLSRAYRVNLSVLAAVALFVGSFLVFSVLSLSVAQRTPALALLGVLGLTARERRLWVLVECAALGALGSLIGLALGTAMAAAALHWLAGDLGGGYFPGITPALAWSTPAALLFAALGMLAAVLGGWWPARRAEALMPALALKGLGEPGGRSPPAWPGLALIALAVALAMLPPIAGLPLAAYAAVACLLLGGVALVPALVQALLRLAPSLHHPLFLLAWRRAAHERATASAATAGVVASLALGVALTVMVGSFREGVSTWLDRVLPADLYARTAATASAAEQAWLPAGIEAQVRTLPGVARVQAGRARALRWAPGQPSVTLFARPLQDPAQSLALISAPLPPPPGAPAAFVSEAMEALYGVQPGQRIVLPLPEGRLEVFVAGVFRDYARQFGTVALDSADYRRATGDLRISDLAVWLTPGADAAHVQAALRQLLPDPGALDFAVTSELRAVSLRIFDRSFAVTRYLQAVAIAIGLVGIAASLSAQVLARRKEFGLLVHLGLTRRQITLVVAGETAAWMAAGALMGLVLGVAVSAVLVHVVNPQSFHWTMELVLPVPTLAALTLAVWACGTATAWMATRASTLQQAVLTVKEDW